jgi:hypothetical protein
VASQSAYSGNWFALVLLIAGISFPLQFERTSSGIPISAISQWREVHCRYKTQNQFPAGNYQP